MNSSNDSDPIQFDTAEFGGDRTAANADGITCGSCGVPIGGEYFTLGSLVHCARCNTTIQTLIATGPGIGGFVRAVGLGVGAAAAGALGWGLVTQLTGYEIGLIAVAVGWLVGGAVRLGSKGLGGVSFQALAVALTYLAIVSTYVPSILEAFDAEQAALVEAGAPEGAIADSAPTRPETLERVVVALVIAFALPFMMGFDNAIGILIIGIALFEAWRRNRRANPVLGGPFQVGAGALEQSS